MKGEPPENWPDPLNESDVYCMQVFADDRDFDLKPWDQNGGRITQDDKDILRAMWKLYNEYSPKQDAKGVTKSSNRHKEHKGDHTIKSRLMELGYGFIGKPRKKK